MGKAANNERIKLRATLFNNISVGLVIGGVAIPILAVYSKIGSLPEPQFLSFVLPLSGAVVAFICGALLHWRALAILKDIQD
jgi:hypothetical protein